MSNLSRLCLASLLAVGLSTPALAHTGVGSAVGFGAGIAHPFGGLDHALAMISVGLVAAQVGGRARWLLPLSFLATMACGGVLGMTGIGLPYVEIGIALSIVTGGLALASRASLPLAALATLTGLFALFHGYAHGAEMPENLSGLSYGAGFLVATAALHGVGLLFGAVLGALQSRHAFRFTGYGLVLAGVAVLARAL